MSKALFRCCMAEGAQVNTLVLKMIGYIERLGCLGFVIDGELLIDLVLQSLPDSYSQFNINAIEKTLSELFIMIVEQDMKKLKPILLVVLARERVKARGKAKAKPNSQNALKPASGVSKDGQVVCFYCGNSGHWRKHCKTFLANNKKNDSSYKGMYMIEINLSPITY